MWWFFLTNRITGGCVCCVLGQLCDNCFELLVTHFFDHRNESKVFLGIFVLLIWELGYLDSPAGNNMNDNLRVC